jgi:hypothetical protein
MDLPKYVAPAITVPAAPPGTFAASVRFRSIPDAPRPEDQRPQGSGPPVPSADTGHIEHELEARASHERSPLTCPGDRGV